MADARVIPIKAKDPKERAKKKAPPSAPPSVSASSGEALAWVCRDCRCAKGQKWQRTMLLPGANRRSPGSQGRRFLAFMRRRYG
jgi:hypothetical protein